MLGGWLLRTASSAMFVGNTGARAGNCASLGWCFLLFSSDSGTTTLRVKRKNAARHAARAAKAASATAVTTAAVLRKRPLPYHAAETSTPWRRRTRAPILDTVDTGTGSGDAAAEDRASMPVTASSFSRREEAAERLRQARASFARRAVSAVKKTILKDRPRSSNASSNAASSTAAGRSDTTYADSIKDFIRERAECIEAVNFLAKLLKRSATQSPLPPLAEVALEVTRLNAEQAARNLPREPTSTTPIAGSASISPITKPDDADGRSSISGTRRDPARPRDTLQMEQMGMRVEYLRGCSRQLRSADRSYWLLSRLSLRQLPSHARVDQWAMHRWAWQQVPLRQWPAPSKRRLSGNISCIPKMETSRQPPRATKQCHRLGFPRTRLLTRLWVMLWVPREPLWGPLRTQQQLPQPLRVLQVLRRAAVVQKTRLEIDLTLCADDGIASWHRCQMLLLGQQLLPAYRQAFACCSPARAWYWRGKRRVSNGDCCFGMSLDSTFGRTAFPCFSGLPTGECVGLVGHATRGTFRSLHFPCGALR